MSCTRTWEWWVKVKIKMIMCVDHLSLSHLPLLFYILIITTAWYHWQSLFTHRGIPHLSKNSSSSCVLVWLSTSQNEDDVHSLLLESSIHSPFLCNISLITTFWMETYIHSKWVCLLNEQHSSSGSSRSYSSYQIVITSLNEDDDDIVSWAKCYAIVVAISWAKSSTISPDNLHSCLVLQYSKWGSWLS